MSGAQLLQLLGIMITVTEIVHNGFFAITDNDVNIVFVNKPDVFQDDLQHGAVAHPEHSLGGIAAELLQAFALAGSRDNGSDLFHSMYL